MTRKPDSAGCALCLDEAVPAEVLAVCESGGSAEVRIGGRASHVATDLIDAVEVGDRLLVHAGFAIARIGD